MKTVLVTGANRGIGLEICRQLDAKNIQVILCSRDIEKGNKAARTLSENVIVRQLDVTSEKSIKNLYSFVAERIGKIDVLINNAALGTSAQETSGKAATKKFIKKYLSGAYNVIKKAKPYIGKSNLFNENIRAATVSLSKAREIMETNFYGPWRIIQYFIPLLEKSKQGKIINVSSGMGALSNLSGSYPAYSLSKAALNSLTVMLANELLAKDIKVNAVCPGWVKTEMGGSDAPRNVSEGAETIVWLACNEDIPTGKFIKDKLIIDW